MNPTPTIGWTVSSQVQSQKLDAAGNVQSGWNVTYTTTNGLSGTVFVPDAVYSDLDTVKAMISAQVANVHAVNQLSG